MGSTILPSLSMNSLAKPRESSADINSATTELSVHLHRDPFDPGQPLIVVEKQIELGPLNVNFKEVDCFETVRFDQLLQGERGGHSGEVR